MFVDNSGCARPPRATCARIVVIVCSDSCGSHIGDSGSVVFLDVPYIGSTTCV